MLGDPTYSRRLILGTGLGVTLTAARPSRAAEVRHDPHVSARRSDLPLIVLDPGHGGKDPGAIGVTGTFEKHIALSTARDLAQRLSRSGLYRVSLTREADHFVALEDRVAYAQSVQAALFVSMHADALTDRGVQGASVYTLAATASDAQTAQLAQRENAADRYGGHTPQGLPPRVARILASLVGRETEVGSARMQQHAVACLSKVTGLLVNPARSADFVVLRAPDIPSVLIEMGFMSNRQDEAALRRPDHRAIIAAAAERAITDYFSADKRFTSIAG